tara:strand:+ start:933 stop:1565 length:633 start_codon:yes stop_codon:yes gene_type:complete
MDLNNRELIIIGEKESASKVMFWFHGYGSNNWSFEPTMKMLNMYMNNDVCIIMPNAPVLDNKRSWYPLPKINGIGTMVEDLEGLESSKAEISNFINSFGIEKDKKLIIGGFSQGAALSLSMLFDTEHNFDDCIALSGYMPNADNYKNTKIKVGRIFIAHGFSDQAISFDDYKKTLEFISRKTDQITSYTDDFGHTITKEVNNRLIDWLSD